MEALYQSWRLPFVHPYIDYHGYLSHFLLPIYEFCCRRFEQELPLVSWIVYCWCHHHLCGQ